VLGGGECARVLLQSFDAEQFCCDRLLVIPFGVVVDAVPPPRPSRPSRPALALAPPARFGSPYWAMFAAS